MSFYILCCDVLNVMYEVFKKPQKRTSAGETREQYYKRMGVWAKAKAKKGAFERRIIKFKQEEINAYEYELVNAAKLMYHSYKDILWTKHHPGNRQGSCGFQSICKYGEGTTTETKKFYTRPVTNHHPEL